MWGTDARLGWDGALLRVAAADGRTAAIAAGGPGRWMLHADGRARPHASISGLLAALHAVLGPASGPGPALRVVPGG